MVAFLDRAMRETACLVRVYCFMPDHLHLIVDGSSADSDIYEAVIKFKMLSGGWARRSGLTLRWQKGFYDHLLRSDEDTASHTGYIVANPVRRGLVVDWRDYPFTGAVGCGLEF